MFLNELQKSPPLIGFTKFKMLKFMLNFGFAVLIVKKNKKLMFCKVFGLKND